MTLHSVSATIRGERYRHHTISSQKPPQANISEPQSRQTEAGRAHFLISLGVLLPSEPYPCFAREWRPVCSECGAFEALELGNAVQRCHTCSDRFVLDRQGARSSHPRRVAQRTRLQTAVPGLGTSGGRLGTSSLAADSRRQDGDVPPHSNGRALTYDRFG